MGMTKEETKTYKVYKLTNNVNGKMYIGYTGCSLKKRLGSYNKKSLVTKAMLEFGKDNFSMVKLHETPNKRHALLLEEFETFLWGTLNPDVGYNLKAGENPSAVTREKIANSRRGKKLSREIRDKISMSSKGYVKTEEHRNRLSVSNTGKIMSDESRVKMSKSKIGRKMSEENKRNISKALRGKPKTKEHIKNISLGKRGLR